MDWNRSELNGVSIERINELNEVLLELAIRAQFIHHRELGPCLALIDIHTQNLIALPSAFGGYAGITHLTVENAEIPNKKKDLFNTVQIDEMAVQMLLGYASLYIQKREHDELLLQAETKRFTECASQFFTPLGIRIEPIEFPLSSTFPLAHVFRLEREKSPEGRKLLIRLLSANGQYNPDPLYINDVDTVVVVPTDTNQREREALALKVQTVFPGNGRRARDGEILFVDGRLLDTWARHPGEVIGLVEQVKPTSRETGDEPEHHMVVSQVWKYLQEQANDLPFEFVLMNGHQKQTKKDRTHANMPDIRIVPKRRASSISPNALTPIWGWSAPKGKAGHPTELTAYDNIGGIKIVPYDLSMRDRKDITRGSAVWLRTNHPVGPSTQVLAVDYRLLAKWREMGKPPFPEYEDLRKAYADKSKKKASDYGFEVWRQRSEPPTVSVDWFEPQVGSHIGAPHLCVKVRWDKTYADALLIDWGWIFSQSEAQSLLDFPKAKDGITPMLRQQLFRPVLRLYRTDLLVNSLDGQVIKTVIEIAKSGSDRKYSIEQFVLLELYHRYGEDGLVQVMRTSEKTRALTKVLENSGQLSPLLAHLREREKEAYQDKIMYRGLWLTHAHQDHTIGSSIIRSEVPRIVSPITQTLLETDFLTTMMFHIKETAIYRNHMPQKNRRVYDVSHFPFQLVNHGDRIEIAPEFFVTAIDGIHSIPGELIPLWEIRHHDQLVHTGFYGGDDKDGTAIRHVAEIAQKRGLPIDLAFVEGTNDDRTLKLGAFTNEDDVRSAFEEKFESIKDENALVIVDVLKNNYARVLNILETAIVAGRTIVLSPKIIYRITRLSQMYAEQQIPKKKKDKFSILVKRLSTILGSDKVKVWARDVKTFKRYEKDIFELYDSVNADELSGLAYEDAGKYILIRELGEPKENLEGITADNVVWIQSTYAAYDAMAKREVESKKKFSARKNFTFVNKGFHTSGHGVFLSSTHPRAEGGIAEAISKVNRKLDGTVSGPDELVTVHTRSRRYISGTVFKSYPGFRDTKIHMHVSHPHPEIIPREQFARFVKRT